MAHQDTTGISGYLTYIVLVEPPPMKITEDERHQWYQSFLPILCVGESGKARLVHSYTEVFDGFASRLTNDELGVVAKKPGFVRAFPDRKRQLMTTHTPKFLRLRNGTGFWSEARYGKGVIIGLLDTGIHATHPFIGLLDTGIHATHPSFDDHGIPPAPKRWKGSCKGSATRCNNKIIGARSFIGGDSEDSLGHGTHTSSTAAGNFVSNASLNGLGVGTAAGIVPGAHISMHKVCTDDSCEDSDVLASLDMAIKDGVDVLSLSIGMGNDTLDKNVVAIGAFSAISKGIIVVCAGGNEGPAMSSTTNDAPWLLTVAAGTVDRSFSADVHLNNADKISGEALNQVAKLSSMPYPLHHDKKQRSCNYDSFDGLAGKILVCESKEPMPQIYNITHNGVAGAILVNTVTDGYTLMLQDYGSGVVQVTAADGLSILNYVTSVSNPTATFTYNNTFLGVHRAPVVALFSSRGPSLVSPGVLKPDIMAPGLNILAAWPPKTKDESAVFDVISGTSMATPHVSGVAVLIKGIHPDWSPATIKSAILMTSDALDNAGGPIMDEQHRKASAYATGVGHVNAARAAEPGLVYDLGVADYAGYICALLGDKALSVIVRNWSMTRKNLPKVSEAQLNYPSITVPLKPTPFTVHRTVTNVGPAKSTYTAMVESPSSLTVRVSLKTLAFSKLGEKKTFSVSVSGHGVDGHKLFSQGSLSWVSGKHIVRSPIVVVAKLGESPPSV
ncbi:hypothetical protein BRADI_1g17320v3 [Brachypodium distachyon]|uniref:Subtilisin-like protease n=2 Tax=Brachypodium distachyon TaxID=15368 RepID=A0A0Q3NCA0_BRADI|nr:hypothetical protein BRADI_1g17320v3 [Brachypodium distachyon]